MVRVANLENVSGSSILVLDTKFGPGCLVIMSINSAVLLLRERNVRKERNVAVLGNRGGEGGYTILLAVVCVDY